MRGYHTLFKEEVQNHLYPFFWLHGESHEVLSDYIDKISESKMQAVCIESRPHPDFIGEQWWDDISFILQKLKEKNMKMWILDDAHFPTGYANGRIKKDYPQYLKLYLNCRRYDVHGPLMKARIDLRTLNGRFWDKIEEDATILGVYLAKRLDNDDQEHDLIDDESIFEITSKMDMKTRLLTCDIPAGAHSIFVVYESFKGAEEATKDYLNPLVKEATQILIDEVYAPHYNHYKEEFGNTIEAFFSDEPRFGNAKGALCSIGSDMPLPWRKGLEKELNFDIRYLPLLWAKGQSKEAEVRLKYMDLITRLYNENFTKVLADWCEEHKVWYVGHTIEDNGAHARLGYGTGHYFRGQEAMHVAGIDVIGTQIVPGMNYHHDAFTTGGSNGEFYHYALAKLATSAAHLDAKKNGRTMCEAFGAYGWNEGLKAMKWIADSLMARGVNMLVPHAFNPKEFPDWDCPPHFYAQGHNPQFRYFNYFDDYVNRVMSIFTNGYYPAKVGLFYPAETEWTGRYMPVEKPCKVLTQHQVSFDIVTRDYLMQASIHLGYYKINETKFEVIIFPTGECIPGDMLEILKEMIQNQIEVIFINELPSKVVGQYNENTWTIVKNGCTVCTLAETKEVLQKYRSIKTTQDERDLVVGEYVRNDMRFYMLFNESTEKTINTQIQFSAKGHLYKYDAFEDSLVRMNTSQLKLSPYESTIFVLSKNKIETGDEAEQGVQKLSVLPEEWEVYFASSTQYPEFTEKVNLRNLDYIHLLDGYDNKTGTVRFQTILELDVVRSAILDLGNVYETAQVFINDVSVGIRLCKPYVFNLSNYLKVGTNKLAIEVTNTLGTQLREPFSHYLPIEPFGIEGPVELKISKKN